MRKLCFSSVLHCKPKTSLGLYTPCVLVNFLFLLKLRLFDQNINAKILYTILTMDLSKLDFDDLDLNFVCIK